MKCTLPKFLPGKQSCSTLGILCVCLSCVEYTIYFSLHTASAHWCPPCRQFTPMLAKFYADAKAAGHPIEIVFVSADRSEKDMIAYFQNDHGDYFAVKYNQAATKQLGPELQVRGIPALHLVDQNGLPKLPADQVTNQEQNTTCSRITFLIIFINHLFSDTCHCL